MPDVTHIEWTDEMRAAVARSRAEVRAGVVNRDKAASNLTHEERVRVIDELKEQRARVLADLEKLVPGVTWLINLHELKDQRA